MIVSNIEALDELKIDITIEDYIIKACSIVSEMEKINDKEVNVIFVDNPFISNLNDKFRGKKTPTDVLSFPFDTGLEDEFLGEIYISIDKAKTQADEFGHSLNREIIFLVVHGLLHLIGYEHGEQANPMMREKEEKVLKELRLYRG
ncbi:rRNA maturation RNase YbeY [Proteinivorax tanatarense]|uniref:Endoribonuclease YbeY n=1 Tax=Proteinivorax tanatarense TaxID=1260629 RepID=A0AAU7VIL2_9FIRM